MARLSAREIGQQITQGKRKPQFIGPKSAEVIIQEIWSLLNTKEAFRQPDYKTKLQNLKARLRSKFGTGYTEELWWNIFKLKV